MRVKIGKKVKDYRTVWIKGHIVRMIDQTKLPHKFQIYNCPNFEETADAIRNMIVRGAPAIGATAAYGMAQAALEGPEIQFNKYMKKVAETFTKTRPTAYNLFWAISRVYEAMEKGKNVKEKIQLAYEEAKKIADEDVEKCKKIGKYGKRRIKEGYRILTHCNAGALATVDYGTALAPIRFAHYDNKKIFVYVDETRPRCQGSKLTAWELEQEDIPHTIIVDNAAGYYMQNGEIDVCIVGADRVVADGSVANKIGTYEKAVLAKENKIPFYVALPLSTIDLSIKSGNEIPIEERSDEEVTHIWGLSEEGLKKVRIASEGSCANNPAFDVTPAKYIRAYITEKGIISPERFKKLFHVKKKKLKE